MIFSWEVKKQSLGKPKGRGLLGNKKRGLSLREKNIKKRGGGFQKKEKRLYSHAILH